MVDAFLKIAERFGVPTAILFVFCLATIAFIRGPLTKFAEAVAGPVAQLVKTHIDFVAKAGAGIGALPGQVQLEAQQTRAHISDEINAAVTALRDRVSDAERAVTATGEHRAVRVSQLPLEPVYVPGQGTPGAPAGTPAASSPAPGAGPPPLPQGPEAALGREPMPPTQPEPRRPPLPTLPSVAPAPSDPAPSRA